jgi:UDP-N-acetylmuramoyl-tripeptide--D-alanyl-D-alanine ligase
MKISELYNIYLEHPNVQTDTRKLQKGDLFFALKGDSFDGNEYAAKAIEMGACYAIIDNQNFYLGEKTLLVDDVLECLQALARFHREQFTIPFIAITGSNGKTTTKELVHTALKTTYITYATEGNLNNHIGVPLTLLKIRKDAQMAIIEMGANHQKEIESYCKIALPTHGLINNCGKAHLEGFGGIEGVRKGKGELYDFLRQHDGTIFINTDYDYLQTMAVGIQNQISYGSTMANLQGTVYRNEPFLEVAIVSPKKECLIKTQMVGAYNFPNVMAAVAVASHFNIHIDTIKKAIEEYAPSNSRSQLITKGSQIIILDAYNANPTSMQEAIKNFALADYANKIVMLGGMKELGADSLLEHQQIIKQLQDTNWIQVILVGGDFKNVHHPYLYFDNAVEAASWYKSQKFDNTAFLIKGSRAYTMEKILE